MKKIFITCIAALTASMSFAQYEGIIASYGFATNTQQGNAGSVFFENLTGDATFDLNKVVGPAIDVIPSAASGVNGNGIDLVESSGTTSRLTSTFTSSAVNISATDSLSIAFWAKYTGDTATWPDNRSFQMISVLNADASNRTIIQLSLFTSTARAKAMTFSSNVLNNGGSFFNNTNNATSQPLSKVWEDQGWHHYIVSVLKDPILDRLDVDIYVDGGVVREINPSGQDGLGGIDSDVSEILLGTQNQTFIDALEFDEVRIAKRAFTTAEIAALSTQGTSSILNSGQGLAADGSVLINGNPVSDGSLKLDATFNGKAFTVNSLNGTQMLSGNYDGSSIDVSSLNAGMYIMTINTTNGVNQAKFIVQ